MKKDLKSLILKAAIRCGCDKDGDIVSYRGKQYYVHGLDGIVKEIRDDN